MLSDLGIEKNKNFNLRDEDITRVKKAVAAACNSPKTEAEASKFSRVVGCCG